jgi:hypothetical protein
MKKLEDLKRSSFVKEMSSEQLKKIKGGLKMLVDSHTRTGCTLVSSGYDQHYECTDDDKEPC